MAYFWDHPFEMTGEALLPGTEPFQEAGVWGGDGGASPPSFRWWPQWGQ